MGLNVFWTDFAKKELNNIFVFYKEKAGSRIAGRLVTGIIKETKNLPDQPYMGQQEDLLADRPEEFRYLVYKRYKIIYWINQGEKRIEIVDIFDARKNSEKIRR